MTKLMASNQLDRFREKSLGDYRRMAIKLAADEEFPSDRISDTCLSAGRTLEDLEHHIGQLRTRRFWFAELRQAPSAARANGREHSANVAALESEIKKLTREFEEKVKGLHEQLVRAQSQAAIENSESRGSRTQAKQALLSTPRPDGWDRDTQRLANSRGEIQGRLPYLNTKRRKLEAAEEDEQVEQIDRQLEEVESHIAELDTQLRERKATEQSWEFIDWSPVGE